MVGGRSLRACRLSGDPCTALHSVQCGAVQAVSPSRSIPSGWRAGARGPNGVSKILAEAIASPRLRSGQARFAPRNDAQITDH